MLNGALAEARRLDERLKVISRYISPGGWPISVRLEAARAMVERGVAPGQDDRCRARSSYIDPSPGRSPRADRPGGGRGADPQGGRRAVQERHIGSVAEGAPRARPGPGGLLSQYTHQSSEVFTVHACRRMAASTCPGPVGWRPRSSRKPSEASPRPDGRRPGHRRPGRRERPARRLLPGLRRFGVRGQGGVWSGAIGRGHGRLAPAGRRRVRPDRLDEFAWRAVSLRWRPRGRQRPDHDHPRQQPDRVDEPWPWRWPSAWPDMTETWPGRSCDARRQRAPRHARGEGSLLAAMAADLDDPGPGQPEPGAEVARLISDVKESEGKSIREDARHDGRQGPGGGPEEVVGDCPDVDHRPGNPPPRGPMIRRVANGRG